MVGFLQWRARYNRRRVTQTIRRRSQNGADLGLGAPRTISQMVACLSQIPLHQITRLAERRSSYGLGFTKDFILERGGGPVWYVEQGS